MVYWVATSWPIVTIGASTTALFYVCFRLRQRNEGKLWQMYIQSFRENLKQATFIWLLYLFVALDVFLVGFSLYRQGLFELADFAVDSGTLTAGVTVRNTGERDGATVVQAYYNDVYSSVITPVKQLCAFERVALPAGGERRVTFAFTPEDFALVTSDERRVTEPGLFEIMVGLSSRDEDLLRETFRI